DGNKWNKIGAPEHSITFAPYNLGADPAYDTPKKQIEYLAACSATDAIKVYGDLYQWGRVADGHEKRNSTTYSGPLTVPDDVDGNGQPNGTSGAIGKFITISGASDNWLTTPKHDLWGNGESLVGQTDNQGGVLYTDGKYYQNTDWTISASNPCASMGAGWRVPTQDEWERLINYDGDPVTVGGDITMDATGQANSSANSAPLTWVPVAGGIASTNWETDTEQKLGGYAVYKTADWDDAAAADYKNGIKNLYETAAPEPILFLPATGYRTGGGSVSEGGNIGYYWSSTVDTFNGEDVSYSFFGDIHGLSFWQDIRVFGDAVRCVKE
ncbi:MAG: fibrobacter succinogenes major paralogous domain-containing protein, partial [Prevotellaceae bacterium]|nr:fibrobacter succinogenes major paralogous domain-containing protein [Prevotellaceae bacterium]